MLSICVECIQQFPETIWIAVAAIPVHSLWIIIWVVTTSSVLNVMNNNLDSSNSINFAVFCLLISLYWTSQVIKNVVHCTVSGIFGCWYFLYPNNMPPSPAKDSFKRAMTTSFGSICFGSFVIAIIKAVKSMVEQGRSSRQPILRCMVVCLLSYLDRIMQYINHYAFTYVAIYGDTYCDGANKTWQLILSRGFDMLINDNLIDGALIFGSFIIGILTGIISTLLAYSAFNLEFWGLYGFIGFLIGLIMGVCTLEVIESTVASCFVCFAEDPAALNRTKPQEYSKLDNAINHRLVFLRAQPTSF